FPGGLTMAFDTLGNLFMASQSTHTVRRIDATSGRLSTVAGVSGTASYSAPFTAASATKLSSPQVISFDPDGNLLVADMGNSSILALSPPASQTANTTTLAKNGGDAQTVVVDQAAPTFLSVKLTDTTGALVGYPVRWTSVDEGGVVSG